MGMKRSSQRVTLGLVAVGLLVAGACSGDDDSVMSQPSSAPVPAIDGKTYLSETVTGRDLVSGSRLRLSFDGGSLGADAGCNQMGGEYQVDDGVLVVDQMMMTEMACMDPPGLMEQEQWFAEFLGSRPSIAEDADRLTLTSSDVTIVFLDRELADPDRPLEGTTWDVTSAIATDTVSSVSAGGSLVFADGMVQVSTGCNTGSGPYELSADGSSITFGAIGITRMACADEEGTRLEQAMIATLVGTVDVDIDAAVLTLTGVDVGLQLTARE